MTSICRPLAHHEPTILERLDESPDSVGVVGERPVAAVVEYRHVGAGEGLALAFGLGDRDVRVVRAPDDQRGPIERA